MGFNQKKITPVATFFYALSLSMSREYTYLVYVSIRSLWFFAINFGFV